MKLELIIFITGLAVIAEAEVTINETVEVGGTAVLTCTVPVKVNRKEWRSEKLGLISVNSDVKFTSKKFQLLNAAQSTADYSLKIMNSSMADADTYTCSGREYKYIVHLTVGVPPSFDGQALKTVTRSLNQHDTLICNAKGTAPFQKQWYRTDGGMKHVMSAGVKDNGNELWLSAQEDPAEQSYECLVENMFGSASITYIVQPADQKTEKVTSQKPKATLYSIQSAKTTETTSSATKQTEIIKPTTEKARSGKAQMTSSSVQTKPQSTMTIATVFVICCFGTIRVF